MADTSPSMSLLERTQQLYNSAPRHIKLKQMAEATGLSMAWISRCINDKFEDPGVKRVQRLHDYLESVCKPEA